MSLKESEEGQKKAGDALYDMRLENFSLSKEYLKSLEETLSVA